MIGGDDNDGVSGPDCGHENQTDVSRESDSEGRNSRDL
jgi:hypothetical protein